MKTHPGIVVADPPLIKYRRGLVATFSLNAENSWLDILEMLLFATLDALTSQISATPKIMTSILSIISFIRKTLFLRCKRTNAIFISICENPIGLIEQIFRLLSTVCQKPTVVASSL